jgi:hypothetical protein
MALSKRSRAAILSTASIVSVAFVASITYIYESPTYSWNPAIRDHDGDGVPDKSDLRPSDPNIWAFREGTLNLTVHKNDTCGIVIILYVESPELDVLWTIGSETWDTQSILYGGMIDDNGDLNVNLTLGWWNGPVGTNVTVQASGGCSSWLHGAPFAFRSVSVVDTQITTLHLAYPDDFIRFRF